MFNPAWRFELLDAEDRPLGTLDGVTGGSSEIVTQSALGGSAQLEMDHRGQELDWMSHRVQAIYSNGTEEWPVGTYLLNSPEEKHSDTTLSFDIGLLTKMNVISRDRLTARHSVPTGADIIPAVVDVLASTGEERFAVTESPLTLASGISWPAGTTKLRVINDLLQAAGYWSLWCDGGGLFRVEPYLNPESRPIAHRFEHGKDSLHLPDWSREQNLSDVPNRFLAIGVGDDENPPLIGVATNNDPASPFSVPTRGHVFSAEPEEGVEAATQEVIDQYAERRLRDLMNPVARLGVGHAMLPLEPNDLVEFVPEDGVRRLATVQRMSMTFDWDTDITAEWREVL